MAVGEWPAGEDAEIRIERAPGGEGFDPAAAYRAMGAAAQAAIGAAAAALAYVDNSVSLAPIRDCDLFAFEAAAEAARNEIARIFRDSLPLGAFFERAAARPSLAALGLAQCRRCGCTDALACEGGCSWVEADLCSACATEDIAGGGR